MSKIIRTRGKNAELAVARVLSAKRNHFEAEDLSHALFSIEVKHRKELPKSVTTWFAQAVRAAAGRQDPVSRHAPGAPGV